MRSMTEGRLRKLRRSWRSPSTSLRLVPLPRFAREDFLYSAESGDSSLPMKPSLVTLASRSTRSARSTQL